MLRPSPIVRLIPLLGTVVAISACSGSSVGPSTVLTGIWGGDHIALTVSDSASHVEFDCAHGDIPSPVAVDARQTFNVNGTYGRDTGGPIRIGQVPDSHPAVYFGSVTASTMALTVQLTDTGDVIGTFILARGSPGRVVKCLLPLEAAVRLPEHQPGS